MYRNFLLLLAGLSLILVNCSRDSLTDQNEPQDQSTERLSKEAINAFVLETLEQEDVFHWSVASDEILWSAISHGHEITAVGYQPAGFSNIKDKIHEIDIAEPEWAQRTR